MTQDIVHPVLGPMRFDEQLNWFEGVFTPRDGQSIQISISLDATESDEAALAEASELLPVLSNLLGAAKQFACDQLLALKNDKWLQEGESPLRPQDFIALLGIESIGFYAEQECELSFRDGDMFWGHTVLLSWNPAEGFGGASIAG